MGTGVMPVPPGSNRRRGEGCRRCAPFVLGQQRSRRRFLAGVARVKFCKGSELGVCWWSKPTYARRLIMQSSLVIMSAVLGVLVYFGTWDWHWLLGTPHQRNGGSRWQDFLYQVKRTGFAAHTGAPIARVMTCALDFCCF